MTFRPSAPFIGAVGDFVNIFRAGRRYAGRVSRCTENKQQEKKYWEDSFHSWLILFCGCRVEDKSGRIRRVKRYWETVRDNLRKAGWNCGCISSTDHEGRQFWVVAAEREDAGRFIVHADEMLIAYLELQAAIHRRFELE